MKLNTALKSIQFQVKWNGIWFMKILLHFEVKGD